MRVDLVYYIDYKDDIEKAKSVLAETAAGMTSPDYKERFRAEYIQTMATSCPVSGKTADLARSGQFQ